MAKKLIAAILCVLMCFAICGCALGDRKFSTEEWIQANNNQKYHYVKDLTENYPLVGMSSQEIRDLLGETYSEYKKGEVGFEEYSSHDDRTDMVFVYRIQEDWLSGWQVLMIRFKDEAVVEVTTGVEDW